MNAVAAISVLHSLSYQFSSILPYVDSLELPEGRMQQVTNQMSLSSSITRTLRMHFKVFYVRC